MVGPPSRGLLCLSLVACAHTSRAPTAPQVPAVQAVERWTAALRPKLESEASDAYRWWISDTLLQRSRQYTVDTKSLPPPGLERDEVTGRQPAPSDSAAFVLAACAAHRFAPMILERTDDTELEDLAERLEELGEDLDLRHGAVMRGTMSDLGKKHDVYARLRQIYERVRGERRDRPPSQIELGALLILGAEVTMYGIRSRELVDPGMNVMPHYYYEPPVPLTLAPLYALSAGADPERVWTADRECIHLLAEAQQDERRLVQPYRRR